MVIIFTSAIIGVETQLTWGGQSHFCHNFFISPRLRRLYGPVLTKNPTASVASTALYVTTVWLPCLLARVPFNGFCIREGSTACGKYLPAATLPTDGSVLPAAATASKL